MKVSRLISPILTLNLIAMATALEWSGKVVRSVIYDQFKYLPYGEKLVQAFAPLTLQSYWTEVRQIFTRCIAVSSQMKLLKSELRYSIPFRNAKATNKSESDDFAHF